MRTVLFTLIIGVFIFIYALLNYYIGSRSWEYIFKYINFINYKLYWIIFWVIAISYVLGRLGEKILPYNLVQVLSYTGAYWLAVMFYSLLIFAAVDLLRLLGRLIGISFKTPPLLLGLFISFLLVGIILYGSWNARSPRLVRYDIPIEKAAGNYQNLNVILVSDIHLGVIVNNFRLKEMVQKINDLNPDLVLFAGDIIDENVKTFVEEQMVDILGKLEPRIGAYAVLGNHEFIGGSADEAVHYLQAAGINVLRDKYTIIENSFYIVGRDDKTVARFTDKKPRDLAEILKDVDKTKPIILIDHQPTELEEAVKAGVDLLVSGHTHRGQLFPNHLITQKIFEVDWGYLKKEALHVIVSSGYGTWGPPIRVGNYPEIVQININFLS